VEAKKLMPKASLERGGAEGGGVSPDFCPSLLTFNNGGDIINSSTEVFYEK